MEVRVKCEFPYVKIMSEPKESDNCITFRGINGDTFQYIDKNGETQETGMFVFNAFGEMKERIKRLKIKKHCRTTPVLKSLFSISSTIRACISCAFITSI